MEDDPVPRAATRRRSGGFRLERPSEEGDDAFTLTLKATHDAECTRRAGDGPAEGGGAGAATAAAPAPPAGACDREPSSRRRSGAFRVENAADENMPWLRESQGDGSVPPSDEAALEAAEGDPAGPSPTRRERPAVASACHGAQGIRPSMEDAHAVVDELEIGPLGGIGIGRQSFYAVYDGHNGKEAADFVCSQLHGQLEQELLVSAHRVHPGTTSRDLDLLVLASLRAAFALTDETYVREGNGDSGCTAVAALLLGARLYVANLGDARCVLCRAGEALAMSEDHSPDRPDEVMRVQGAGGFVENGRVMGKIAVARAFGDAKFKDPESSILKPHGVSRPVVSAEPDFVIKDVDGEGNEFLLLACDGLFDVMTNQAATDFVRERLAAGSALPAICEDLANHALQIGSTDNVSVMVVKLTPPAAGAEDRTPAAAVCPVDI